MLNKLPTLIFLVLFFLANSCYSSSVPVDEIQPNLKYTIRSSYHGNFALTIDETGKIVVKPYVGSARQHWYFSPHCDYFYIASQKTPKVLGSYGPAPTHQCHAEDYQADRSQRWKLGTSHLKGYHLYNWEGKALNVKCYYDGGPVDVERFHGWHSQVWMIHAVDS